MEDGEWWFTSVGRFSPVMGALFARPRVWMGILFRLGPIFNTPILDKIMFPLPHRGWEACLGVRHDVECATVPAWAG